MVEFHLALTALWQRMCTLGVLAFLLVDLGPEALIAEDVTTGQPFRVLCKYALAEGTLELLVHLLIELHRQRAKRVLTIAPLLLGWPLLKDAFMFACSYLLYVVQQF